MIKVGWINDKSFETLSLVLFSNLSSAFFTLTVSDPLFSPSFIIDIEYLDRKLKLLMHSLSSFPFNISSFIPFKMSLRNFISFESEQ